MVGNTYRHFKGNEYVVDDIGVDSEDNKLLVVYHAVDDQTLVWIRPLNIFLSDVDHDKYPDVKQLKRFELVVKHETC